MNGIVSPVLKRVIGAVALLCAAVLLPALAQEPTPQAPPQAPLPPLQKSALITALQTGGLPAATVADIINRRGLAFPMSVADEQELRAAGASDLVVDALWAKENFEIKAGPPLTEEGLIESLQAGVPPRRLEKMVRLRQAKVTPGRELADKIKAAGGTDALLGTIVANIYEPPPPPPPAPVPAPVVPATVKPAEPPKPDPAKRYDDLLKQAADLRKSGNHGRAADVLTEAEKLDPQRPEAYALTGLIFMESEGSVLRARSEYSAAIAHNGEITVPMVHIQGHKALKQKTCRGGMTISRTVIKYACAGGDTFTIETGRIKDVAINTSKITLGMLGGSFHITWTDMPVGQREEDFRVDINKDDKEADRVIVELIKKCLAH